ncbi:MAG: zinc ribbon domain-containing protein [Clostridia bacterium]
MAIIKCPECEKEISDTSKKCINCGYTFKRKIIINKKVASIVSIVVGIIAVVLLILYFAVQLPKQNYETAISLSEQGKYDEAISLLDSLGDYKDVSTLKEELKYESKLYICINNLKKSLKNPDSLQLHDIKFFTNEKTKDTKSYITIIHYGGQNGFGGNTTGYALFSTDNNLGGSCNTLDIDDIDRKDFSDRLTCLIINTHLKSSTKVGSININRVKKILKNDAYSTIKIIN